MLGDLSIPCGGYQPLGVGWGKSWSPHGGPAHQAKSDCRPHCWLNGPICRESERVQAPKKCKCEHRLPLLCPRHTPRAAELPSDSPSYRWPTHLLGTPGYVHGACGGVGAVF